MRLDYAFVKLWNLVFSNGHILLASKLGAIFGPRLDKGTAGVEMRPL